MTSPATIVIVEDSDDVREALTLGLEGHGFIVLPCEDACRALAIIRERRPDLVITDVMLGVTSGLELLTHIRSDLVPPIPPVIVCSGFGDFEREALRRGAVTFLPKPFHMRSMLDAVDAALGLHPPAHDARERSAVESRALRAASVQAALEALRRLEPLRADLQRRARWTLQWLPRYFGSIELVWLLEAAAGLQIFASSDEARLRPGERAGDRLPLAIDIVETGSSVVLPRAEEYGHTAISFDGPLLRGLFAGVPLRSGALAVGALCLLADEPRVLDAADFALLEEVGQRVSALLSGTPADSPPPLWDDTGLLSAHALQLILGNELRRSQHAGTEIGILVAATGESEVIDVADRLLESSLGISPERLAIGALADDRIGMLLIRPSRGALEVDLLTALRHLRALVGTHPVAMLSIDGGLPAFLEHDLLRLAQETLDREATAGRVDVSRIVLRREPIFESAPEHAPESP
jgi:DNA-binding response OmpR family regulator